MTIIIIIIIYLFSEPYDYYYRPRVLSVYFVFITLWLLLFFGGHLQNRLQNDTEKTKTAFFFKLSHKMGHMKTLVCIFLVEI